ncbi:hypothetical protein BDR05DRAFT_955091 [Suillus weaverae]|nr:hypothetical protein BDR05DRAFT_955091 [Suillus weaverae]
MEHRCSRKLPIATNIDIAWGQAFDGFVPSHGLFVDDALYTCMLAFKLQAMYVKQWRRTLQCPPPSPWTILSTINNSIEKNEFPLYPCSVNHL